MVKQQVHMTGEREKNNFMLVPRAAFVEKNKMLTLWSSVCI
jgi:hypothetical protein